MNVLFVIVTLEGGGAQKLLNDLAPRLNHTDRCEILVLSKKNDRFSENLKKNGIKVSFIPDNIKRGIKIIKYIDKYIEQGNFDIIHSHLFPTLYYCSILKRMKYRDLPFIFTEHNTDNRRRHLKWMRPLEKWMYNPYDFIISISQETQLSLMEWLGATREKREKFCVINNGIPVENYISAVSYNRNDIGIDIVNNDVLLCMIGSFTEQKNHRFMIAVMEGLPVNYKLLLLGEGILSGQIHALVKEKRLENRVFFMGFRNDVASIVKASDIVVIPSKWEGFGLVAVEAMACGKQVVCTDVPGLSAVIGEAGIKVKPKDIGAFIEALEEAASKTGENNTIDNCIEQAKKFDVEVMKNSYLKLYEKCMKEKEICCKYNF